MKFNNFFKIFVVCFVLVAVLTVSCFATSATTSSNVYGHYISPGEYIFNDVLDFSYFSDVLQFDFYCNNNQYYGFTFFGDVASDFRFYTTDEYLSTILVYDSSTGWVDESFKRITLYDGFYIYDSNLFTFWNQNLTTSNLGFDNSLFNTFLGIFIMICQWMSESVNSMITMFWVNNSLTFLGTLAVSALAFAVVFLIIGFISRFLKFRG